MLPEVIDEETPIPRTSIFPYSSINYSHECCYHDVGVYLLSIGDHLLFKEITSIPKRIRFSDKFE
jgi:hypothetical protein